MKVSYIILHFPPLKIPLFQLGLNFEMISKLRRGLINKKIHVRRTD